MEEGRTTQTKYYFNEVLIMAVTVKTRKETYRLNREEFTALMHGLWERAQTRKLVREELEKEREEKKKNKNN
jgi:hypothetical protein